MQNTINSWRYLTSKYHVKIMLKANWKKEKSWKKFFGFFLNFFQKIQISMIDRLMSFHSFGMNFGAKESWKFTFEHEKVFYPTQKFFTPSFLNGVCTIKSWKLLLHQMLIGWGEEKGGKKLLGGVKNFWFEKSIFLALICTKNHCKILKIRLHSSTQSLVLNVFLNRF